MQYLFLDIASHQGLIACGTESEALSAKSCGTRIRDDELIPLVEDLLKEAGWSYSDLTHVACITGPGGFTSLRVAVTFANTLADQLEIPSTGIHLSDLCRARSNDDVVWLHSTKKDQLFVRLPDEEPELCPIDQLASRLKGQARWVGELIEEHKTVVDSLGLSKQKMKPAEEILPPLLISLQYGQGLLKPWYGRNP